MSEEKNDFQKSVHIDENVNQPGEIKGIHKSFILKAGIYIFIFYLIPLSILMYLDYFDINFGWGGVLISGIIVLIWYAATIAAIVILLVMGYKRKLKSIINRSKNSADK